MTMKQRLIQVDLSGLTAFVTGGSRGIAAALVEALAANGADVAFSYAAAADEAAGKPDAAEALCRTIAAAGGRAQAFQSDLTQPGAAEPAAREAERRLGRVDILVLSASVQVHKPFATMPAADVARQMQINLTANIETLQALLPGMRERRFGRVITIGSVQESSPSTEMPIYAMTKGALENLVRCLALENAAFGVTVNNIAPGLVQTDRNAFRRTDMDGWNRLSRAANPMRRAGQPADIVGAALFLVSDSAAFVTGATIQVTGGAHIPRGANDIIRTWTATPEAPADPLLTNEIRSERVVEGAKP